MLVRVADLGRHVLDLQGPHALGLLPPAVHRHELPVGKAFVGVVQQPAMETGVRGVVGGGPRVALSPGDHPVQLRHLRVRV